MAVLSTLSRLSPIATFIRNKALLTNQKNQFLQVVRCMGGGDDDRTMHITPSRFQYTKFKDSLHFYLSIGIIPLVLFVTYVNIFIGSATLEEIPEGYEPKHWEYFKHPITRFFCEHFYSDPQIAYERNLHGIWEHQEKTKWGETIEKVEKLMEERDDYKAWYFHKSDKGKHIRKAREIADEMLENRGYR